MGPSSCSSGWPDATMTARCLLVAVFAVPLLLGQGASAAGGSSWSQQQVTGSPTYQGSSFGVCADGSTPLECSVRPCSVLRCGAGYECRETNCAGCNAWCEAVAAPAPLPSPPPYRQGPTSKPAAVPAAVPAAPPVALGSNCIQTPPGNQRQRCIMEWVFIKGPRTPSCRTLGTIMQQLACCNAWVDSKHAPCAQALRACSAVVPGSATCKRSYQLCVNKWVLDQQAGEARYPGKPRASPKPGVTPKPGATPKPPASPAPKAPPKLPSPPKPSASPTIKPPAKPTPPPSPTLKPVPVATVQQCVLPLTINPDESVLELGGKVSSPVSATIKQAGSKPQAAGTIYVVFPLGKCPSPSELGDALSGARLANPSGSPGLYTIPNAPRATVDAGFLGTVADVTVNGLRGGVKGAIDPESLSTSFRVTATAGEATIDSALLGNQAPLQLVGRAFAGDGCTVSATQEGTSVQLQCYGLMLSQPVQTSSVRATLWLRGDVVAAGDLAAATLVDAKKIPGP